uniref:G protein-coupled receptor n=1 Tax=Panagrellus redivivus TaxID=6233 RepID=A0A7E4VZH3_PANRE
MPAFGTIVYIIEIVASAASYFCNGCLLYCVLKNWKPGLKRLNMILIQNIILDCTYAIFPVFTGVWMAIINGKLYIISTGLVKYTNYNIAGYAYCMYCSVLSLCMYAFPMQFYLRYKTLCRSDEVSSWFHGALWACLLCSCFGTCVCLGFAYNFGDNLHVYDVHAANVISTFVVIDENTPFAVGDTITICYLPHN